MNVIGFENNNRVVATIKNANKPVDFKVLEPLSTLLNRLLIERPLWEFRVEQPYYGDGAQIIAIYQDGEGLGSVQWGWAGGSNKYIVSNERISNQRQRGKGYSTKDIDKAVLKVKKMFSQASLAEKIDKASETLDSAMGSVNHNKFYELRNTENAVRKHMLDYVQTVGWGAFVAHMEKTDVVVTNTIGKLKKLEQEADHMKAISDTVQNGKALLVVREGSVYIVKSKEGLKTYNDSDLPDHMRLKLGMLKLIEDKQYVTDVGFRANSDVFAVLNEEMKDE